jgi:carbamoyltransferase
MHILGVSCFYHDAAAAILRDGMLVAAAEEERFSRKKHDAGFPRQAIGFCLRQAGISAQDLDFAVFYEKPFVKFERILKTVLGTAPRSARLFRESMASWLGEKLWLKSALLEQLGIPENRLLFAEHHLSHAASALFCSPFSEAAILTVDGVGEWSTATLGTGKADWDGAGENRIELFAELRFPQSLGLLYSAFTEYLGFEVNEGEYKVMGMAPYGRPRYVDRVWRLLDCKSDGSFALDLDYFAYHHSTRHTINERFEALFGPRRNPRARFVTPQTSLYDDPVPPTPGELVENQRFADVAASIQAVTEEILLRMARHLHERTGLSQLCMAGGVALNSVANSRTLREGPFTELYVHPAAGDSGGAIGAAQYAWHCLLGKPRQFIMEHAYWGESLTTTRAADFVRQERLPHLVLDDDRLLERVVAALLEGKVVGWAQGRFEWGPRALGNRSILADPRRSDMKDIVNIKIKFREPFRPFAPSVLREKANAFFHLDGLEQQFPPRFMLMVVPVREHQRCALPAITHVDGTGRVQVVDREANPRYHRLIEMFGQASGVPVLLNTSFNLKGEPIVGSPEEAYRTFQRSGIDMLVLENVLIEKDWKC